MLDKKKHETILKSILKDIYKDTLLSQYLVFKGGTACYLFYNLPRFSVDLDFSMRKEIDMDTRKKILDRLCVIAEGYGKVEECRDKRYTLFVLLRHTKGQHYVKLEVSKVSTADAYDFVDYFGLSIPVLKKEKMFAEKLTALTSRKSVATRDLFDIHFFFKEFWPLDEAYLKRLTDKSASDYLNYCADFIKEKIQPETILMGLGQLIDEKQRIWVKENLAEDTIFQIRNYLD